MLIEKPTIYYYVCQTPDGAQLLKCNINDPKNVVRLINSCFKNYQCLYYFQGENIKNNFTATSNDPNSSEVKDIFDLKQFHPYITQHLLEQTQENCYPLEFLQRTISQFGEYPKDKVWQEMQDINNYILYKKHEGIHYTVIIHTSSMWRVIFASRLLPKEINHVLTNTLNNIQELHFGEVSLTTALLMQEVPYTFKILEEIFPNEEIEEILIHPKISKELVDKILDECHNPETVLVR